VYIIVEYLFWIIILLVFYIYFGYPQILSIITHFRPVPQIKKADIHPTDFLIIAAYNEEKTITQKIENSLKLDYPPEKLEIIVASDDSTDETNEIAKGFSGNGVKLAALVGVARFLMGKRAGKWEPVRE